MFGIFKKPRPDWLTAYKEQTPGKLPQSESDVVYSVLDLETTGFEPLIDRILSVAIARIHGDQLKTNEIEEWVVFQQSAEVNEAVKVHGILPSETQNGVSESLMLEELLRRIKGTIVVGHHIHFDARMLNVAMERHFGIPFRNRILDTATMARSELDAFKKSGYSNQRPPNLDEVCQQLGINPIDRHTAIGDVFTTSQVFLYLKGKQRQRLKERFTVKSLPFDKI